MKEQQTASPVVMYALTLGLAAYTLWDYYFGSFGKGLRLFDLMATAMVLGALIAVLCLGGFQAASRIRASLPQWILVLAFVSVFVIAGVFGSFRNAENLLRPTVGIWLGVLVFVIYQGANVSPRWLVRVTSWLIVLHATALLAQLIVQKTTGVLLNYQSIIGAEPRVFSQIFRPSGLFLEPSAYALTAIMLLLLRATVRPGRDWVVWLGLLSVAVTVSLFGMIAVCCFLVFFFWRRPWFWLLAVALVVAIMLALAAFEHNPAVVFLNTRFDRIGTDASLMIRYRGLIEAIGGGGDGDATQFWFGTGLGNDNVEFGASGYGVIISSIGVMGTFLWLSLITALAPPGRRFSVLFSLCLVLVAAPIWTMMWWWAWIGLLLNPATSPRLHLAGDSSRGARSPLLRAPRVSGALS